MNLEKKIITNFKEYFNLYHKSNSFNIDNLFLDNLVLEYNEPFDENKIHLCISKDYKPNYILNFDNHILYLSRIKIRKKI